MSGVKNLFKAPTMPAAPPVTPMPDPQNKLAMNRRKRAATKRYGEGGRESTILSGKLGG
jgi:hypothetical protein